jgi:UDP-N-acetylglucosamine--N-acetylmuramyl-(pentapeptide) pyrophosphoryl-undecaprenol N-acetylglucosamine transferase
MKKKIVFTGGGTAGHVTPNIALIEVMQAQDWIVDYIGSKDGVEKDMIRSMNIPYHAVRCGKLRRYFSWKNYSDPINMMLGIVQAYWLLRKIKPNIVFSKGGFVAFPVVVGAWLNRIPVIAHESDLSPGLANRLSFPFVDKICVTFSAGKNYFKHQEKIETTGTPIRDALLKGDRACGLALCGFSNERPCLLIIGGSQGSTIINQCVRQALDGLCQRFQIIHLCGKGNIDENLIEKEGYYQLEYAHTQLAHLFAAADIVISRAGANSLYEILALGKPHILIPLSKKASRGDQIQNARYFEKQGISVVIDEDALTPQTLLSAVDSVLEQQEAIIKKIHLLQIKSATLNIVKLINEAALP